MSHTEMSNKEIDKSKMTTDSEIKPYSTRWYVLSYIGCVLFVAICLWGLYVPALRYFASNHIEIGDAFVARAQELERSAETLVSGDTSPGDRPLGDTDVEELLLTEDAELIEIRRRLNDYFRLNNYLSVIRNIPSQRDLAEERKVTALVRELAETTPELNQRLIQLIERHGLADTFQSRVESFRARAKSFQQALDAAAAAPLSPESISFYSNAMSFESPEYVVSMRTLVALFDPMEAYDIALREYVDASSIDRFWQEPRWKLANLYVKREWPSFAMEEFLKVIKLDPNGDAADEALAEIEKIDHFEQPFYMGVGHLLREEFDAAANEFERFVKHNPAALRGPKTEEVLRHIRNGDFTYARRFAHNEIWI